MKLLRKRKGKWFAVAVLTAVGLVFAGPVLADEISATSESDQLSATVPVSEPTSETGGWSDLSVESESPAAEPDQDRAISESVAETEQAESLSQAEMPTQSENSAMTVPAEFSETSEAVAGDTPANELSQEAAPLSGQVPDNQTLLKTPQAWEAGYKGQGQVIAIIDSGIDMSHDAFSPLEDVSQARYQNAMQLEAAKLSAGIDYGKWYNNKVVFAYNYNELNDNMKEADPLSHGTHVSSIAAGNPSQPVELAAAGQPSATELVTGVAPEAQLMMMRVSSEHAGTVGTSDYLHSKAVEDAVKLGATVINLSIAASTGAQKEIGDSLTKAIRAARQAGTIVTISGGNSGVFGSGYAKPTADSPDYGLVSMPSVVEEGLSVASYNNSSTIGKAVKVIETKADAPFTQSYIEINTDSNNSREILLSDTYKNKTFDYVYTGLGQMDDFSGLDLSGKIALIQRGSLSFDDKIKNAKAAGAVGVIIFNQEGEETTFGIGGLSNAGIEGFPVLSMAYSAGRYLAEHAGHYQLTFPEEDVKFPNPTAHQLSAFSSWGMTADGELKPDVSAPGGTIYAAVNDGKYASQSGTSMAAPHAAGAAALLRQQFKAKYPELSGPELSKRLKQLIMSSADPHFNWETQAYTSPRQQGAGLINLEKALHSTIYATGTDGYASVNLGNVADSFSFDTVLHNTADHAQTFSYVTNITTDGVEDGRFTLKPRGLYETARQEVTVPAQSSSKVTITVDTSAYSQELREAMPNGYYLEGFVRFLTAEGREAASLPFVGFRGEFQNLPVIEKPIYQGEAPFYGTNKSDDGFDFTHLVGGSARYNRATGKYNLDGELLGQYVDRTGQISLREDMMAFSPDTTKNSMYHHKDSILLRATFLRNAQNLKATVYADSDIERQNPIWQGPEESMMSKSYYSGQTAKAFSLTNTSWIGEDNNGQLVEDGYYQYVISYRPVVPGAEEQEMSFRVLVDTQAPSLESVTYDKAQGTVKINGLTDSLSGLYDTYTYLSWLSSDEAGNQTEHKVYPDDLGQYQLGPDVDLLKHKVFLIAEDKAGNILAKSLAELLGLGQSEELTKDINPSVDSPSQDILAKQLSPLPLPVGGNPFAEGPLADNMGRVDFSFPDNKTGEDLSYYGATNGLGSRIEIRDAAGRTVAMAGNGYPVDLPYGDYLATLRLYNQDRAKLLSPTTQAFSLSPDHRRADVAFRVEGISKTPFRVSFNEELPEGSRVWLTGQDDQRYQLPKGRYVPHVHELAIPDGDYLISVDLPEDYTVNQSPIPVTVNQGHQQLELSWNRTESGIKIGKV